MPTHTLEAAQHKAARMGWMLAPAPHGYLAYPAWMGTDSYSKTDRFQLGIYNSSYGAVLAEIERQIDEQLDQMVAAWQQTRMAHRLMRSRQGSKPREGAPS